MAGVVRSMAAVGSVVLLCLASALVAVDGDLDALARVFSLYSRTTTPASEDPPLEDDFSGQLLTQQIEAASEQGDVKAVASLHMAAAKLHRSARRHAKALFHLQAAREYAMRADDRDLITHAHLLLGEALLHEWQPEEAEKQLDVAFIRLGHADDHTNFAVKRAQGQASRMLGHLPHALRRWQFAQKNAQTVEDDAGLLSDIGEVLTLQGQEAEAIQHLRRALQRLGAVEDPLPGAPAISAALHLRLAEAFRSRGEASDVSEAERQYTKALRFEERLPVPQAFRIGKIRGAIRRLREGPFRSEVAPFWPALWRCAGSRAVLGERAFAEEERPAELRSGMRVAEAMNFLARSCSAKHMHVEAAEAFLLALSASLADVSSEGGLRSVESKHAYLGLTECAAELRLAGRESDASALVAQAVSIADTAGIPKDSQLRAGFEDRLRAAKSRPSLVRVAVCPDGAVAPSDGGACVKADPMAASTDQRVDAV